MPDKSPIPVGPSGPVARLVARDRVLSRRIACDWPHPRWLTHLIGGISLTANYGIVWFAIALVPLLSGAPHGPRKFVFIAGPVLGIELITFGLKVLFDRRRPPERERGNAHVIPLPSSRSFPSAHASMGMVGLFATASVYPKWLAPLAAFVALLAFSRIYLRVHYVADVLAGLLLGTVAGLLLIEFVAAPQ